MWRPSPCYLANWSAAAGSKCRLLCQTVIAVWMQGELEIVCFYPEVNMEVSPEGGATQRQVLFFIFFYQIVLHGGTPEGEGRDARDEIIT